MPLRTLRRVVALRLLGALLAPVSAPGATQPEAVGFRSAYQVFLRSRKQSPWCRLLVVYQKGGASIQAHAYCVFSVDGKLWSYSQDGGSQRAWIKDADRNDAEKFGRQLAANSFVRAVWVDSPR